MRGYPDAAQPPFRAEATRILANALLSKQGLPSSDRSYLAGHIASRAGVSRQEADQRVDAFITNSKATLDKARKAAAAAALFAGLSMLIGAFIASVAAALGGQRRDAHVAIA